MPYISTEISAYLYKLFPVQDGSATIGLYNNAGINFATAFARPDTETIPSAFIDSDGKYRMYFHRRYFSDVLDMLRNEKPTYFHYWDGGGGNSHLSTTKEPVGENE